MIGIIQVPESRVPVPGARTYLGDQGASIALFNVERNLYAIDDACPHSGGSLSGGKLEGLMLQCPAHGLKLALQRDACVAVAICEFEVIRSIALMVRSLFGCPPRATTSATQVFQSTCAERRTMDPAMPPKSSSASGVKRFLSQQHRRNGAAKKSHPKVACKVPPWGERRWKPHDLKDLIHKDADLTCVLQTVTAAV